MTAETFAGMIQISDIVGAKLLHKRKGDSHGIFQRAKVRVAARG